MPIAEHHKDIKPYMDLLYVNILTFIHTGSGKIDFRSVQACVSRPKSIIMKRLKNVKKGYDIRGFKITAYHGDNDFYIQAMGIALLHGLIKFFPGINTLI